MTKSMNRRLSQSSLKNANHKARDLRMESLEERQLLSVSPVSAASDDVDYACIAPAEMVPMESAPVVEMNLTDEVPVKDVPVELAAYSQTLQAGTSIDFGGYNFTAVGSNATYETSGTSISISGNISITDHESDDGSVEIISDGTLSVETTLKTGSSISMTSGTLTVSSGCDVPTVTSSGITIEGAGTIGTLNLNGGTTTVSGGTVGSTTGSGDLKVTNGEVTKAEASGKVIVDGGTVGTVSNSTDITLDSGSITLVELKSGGATTTINGAGKITEVKSIGNSIISGAGNIGMLTLTDGTTTTVSGTTIDETSTGTGNLTVTGGKVTNSYTSGAISVSGGTVTNIENSQEITLNTPGTIGTVTLVSGTDEDNPAVTTINGSGTIGTVKSNGSSDIAGSGKIGTLTLNSGTTDVSGTTVSETTGAGVLHVSGGAVTEAKGTGAVSISDGTIGTVTNASGVQCTAAGKITTVTIAGLTEVSTNGHIDSVTGTGAVSITGGTIGSVTNASGVTSSGGTITTVEISGTTTLEGAGTIDEVKGSGAVIISDGKINKVSGSNSISLSNTGEIGTVSGDGNIDISGGKITTVSGDGEITVDGGTIEHITSAADGPVTINGTENPDTITVGSTVTVGSTASVTFDAGGAAPVTINGGEGDDTITANAKPTSGTLTASVASGTDTFNGTGTIDSLTVDNATANITNGTITDASGLGKIKVAAPGTVTNSINLTSDLTVDFCGYTFTGTSEGATITITDANSVSVSGNVTVTDDTSTADTSIGITSTSGNLTVNTTLTGDSSVTIGSGSTLTVAQDCTVPAVNSSGCTISGSGTVTALDLVSGTTTVSGGTVGTTTGAGAVSVTGGTITNANGTGAVSVSTGTIGTVTNASSVECSGGKITTVTTSGTTTVSGTGAITNVNGDGAVSISGGTIDTVTNASSVECSGGKITTVTTSGTTTVSGTGAITNVNGDGAVSISGGTIDTVTNASGVECSGGTITTVTTSGTTTVSGTGAITNVNGDGAVSISGGTIDTVTNASSVECSGGKITTVTTSGTTTVSGTGAITNVNGDGAVSISAGTIDEVSGNGAVTVTGGKITTASGNGNIAISNGEITTASGTGTINVTGGKIGTASGSGLITISNGEVTNVTGDSAISISNTGEIGTVSGNGDISISGGEIATASGSGAITITDGTIGAVTGASPVTVDGGTINSLNGSGAVVINGTTGNDEITVGETLTTGTASVTFGDSCASDVTINGGEGADYIKVTGKKTSGAMTLNGGAGNDVLISGGEAVTVNGEGGSDLVVTGAFAGSDDTLKTWDGDAATALNWSLDGTLSDSTVAAATASATVNADNTDMLYYNTSGAAPTINGTPALVLTSTSTTVVVTAASESDISATTITMSEAYTALNGGTLEGDYTLGFANASYTLDQALTSNYTNTGHKLTIDGTKVYNGVTGAAGSAGTVTVTVGNFTNTDANMTFATGTTVVIDGLVYTGSSSMSLNKGVGIYNSGTLTLTGGATVSKFNANGIENVSTNTLIVEDGIISGNAGYGIYNTGTATLQGSTAAAVSIDHNVAGGVYNASGATLNVTGAEITRNGYKLEGTTETKLNDTASGIVNEGMAEIGVSTGGSAGNVVISYNSAYGIENTSAGVVDGEGVITTPGLQVYNATINNNLKDGIYNHDGGSATIGVSGKTCADIQIHRNKHDGIDNEGTGSILIVHNAEIFKNGSGNASYSGINNRDGATATIDGTTAETDKAIDIHENYGNGIRNGVSAIMTIGSKDTGKAANVVIKENVYDGILMQYADGEVTIYNATISENKQFGIDLKNDPSALNLLGNSSEDLVIYKSGYSGVNNEGGGTVTVTKATFDSNGYRKQPEESGKDGGDGINNRIGKTIIGTYNPETGEVGAAGDVVITNNTRYGIQNGQNSNSCELIIYNATIGGEDGKGNLNGGIYSSKGEVTIGVENRENETTDVVISYNRNDYTGNSKVRGNGIYNSQGTLTINNADISYNANNGIQSSGNLYVKKATISHNTKDGIYDFNEGTAKRVVEIGTQGSGEAGDVVITENGQDGIGNREYNSELTIYNAKITKNGRHGIDNGEDDTHQGVGFTHIYGNTVDAVMIAENTGNGIYNSSEDELDILKATIKDNKQCGIMNKHGKVVIGTPVQVVDPETGAILSEVGKAEDVVISGNRGDGIENYYNELTIYNVTIKDQRFVDEGIRSSYGINNKSGFVNLIGNTSKDILITGNYSGGIQNMDGEHTSSGAEIQGTLVITKATITQNGNSGYTGTENWGHGIYNRDGHVTLGTADGNTDDVKITANVKDGIHNDPKTASHLASDLKIIKAVISGNGNHGIDNEGTLMLEGTGTGANSSIQITGNTGDGIYNEADLRNIQQKGVYIYNNTRNGIENVVTTRSSGYLHITQATIDNNTLDGIYNSGTVKVGIGGETGSATDVMITNNKSDGIENISNDTIEVYDATISGNTDYGINNSGTAKIYGIGAGAESTVQIKTNPTGIYNTGTLLVSGANITENTNYGINNAGGTATLEGSGAGASSTVQISGSQTGILNSATLDITGATVSGNTNIGIDNQNGVAKLKGSGTGTSSSVQVTGQPLGIYNTGAASNLEISGAYITTNTTSGVGIQNHGGNATLEGATAAAVQVTGSKTGILNEYVDDTQKGNLTITGASVSNNSGWGIDNQGGIVTINGESVDKVLVNNNDAGGIRNANTTSPASTGTLSVSGATIQFNGDENTSTDDGDGIYNEGVATIGEGATVLIDRNQGDGIENKGASADLKVYNATISTNGKNANAYDYGIYNHQGGTALLDGASAAAIVIRDNGRSDDDALSGGIYNGTGSEFTIRKATITENHHHGIENDGTMVIGTDADGHGKDEVLITSNVGDGIENKGAGANLTIYNATIKDNAYKNVIDASYDYGIDNNGGGTVVLNGNTGGAIYITNNGWNDNYVDDDPTVPEDSTEPEGSVSPTQNLSGGIYNGANSNFTIIRATVTENHHHGIENFGTMILGTEPVTAGSTTVGPASDVEVTKNKGNGIDNMSGGLLTIYNGNISENAYSADATGHVETNNGIRNEGTMVIGVQGSADASAVKINKNKGNGILNKSGGDATIYNVTIDGNTNDPHTKDNPNNNGIRNNSGAKLRLKGTLGTDGMESIRLTNNGEDGLFNAANLSGEEYVVEHVYAAFNGSEGIEQNRLKGSDVTPSMTILSGTIYQNGYGSTDDKYGFGIHVKRGTMNLKGADASSINIYENYQSGIRVENDSVLNVEKATINQNGRNDNGDGIHASGTSQVTIGINGHAASEVLITNNKRSGIQIADTNTKLTVYNATISGNNGPRTDVPHHGINNKGQTKLLGTGSGEDATIQILENGEHGIYNNYIIDQAQGLYIEGNGLRGIKNEKTFTQTGAIDVVNNVGGGIDNTATGTYIQNAGTTLNVLNNKGAEDGGVYQGVDDDGAGIKNTGTLTLDGTVTITGNVGIRNGGGLYQGGTLTNDLNETLTIQDNEATNGGGVYVAAYTKLNNGTADSTTGMGTISGNTATANGGGIYVEAGKTLQTVSAATGNVTHNTAQNGAGIYNAGNLKFYGPVSVDGNTATGNGGGIYQGGEILNGLDTKLTVTNNTAGNGGGVYVAAATTLKNGTTNTITGNSATNGGGIYVEAGKTLTFETSNITGNTGTNGGGMYLAGTLANSDGTAELTFENNDTTAETLGSGGALYIANGATYGPTNGTFTLNRQEDFHFINNGHYTSETDATRGGAIYNAGKLQVANTNYGFGVTVTGDPNGVKTMTPNNEINTGIGAAVYNAGTFTNASEYKAFHAGGIDDDGTVDKSTHKTYSFYVTGQAGESAFASSGSTTLSNAKIYGNSAGGLRVDDGLTTLTQGTEIGSGAFILATTSYANYAGGFGKNTGYGVKVTGGSLQSTEAQTYAQYTNKRKNTGVADSARYEDYKVADAVQISGNTSTAIIVEGTGKVFLNDMRAESNGAAGLNAAATAGGYITNAVIEGTIDRGGVTLVNTTIPGVTETDTTNNIAGENASGNRFVVDELGNTYTLNSDFDAIDKGNNDNAVYHFADGTTRTIKHDLGGHDRILNGRVDLGAFECPISWITNTMFIDDIKYAVEHCAPVAFGGKVKFDINCNGKVFYWDEDPRALNPPSKHDVDPIITYVDKDTILDARYEDADGNYYWMDIVMDFGNYSTGFGIYYSDVTFNVYGLTVVATNGGTSKNGSAFYVPELRKGGSVVNLYGVSCYDCTAAYGGAIYGETNAVINVYTDVTAAGYVKGSSTTYVVGGKTHYQPANNQAKVSQADTYRACVFEGNTGTYGGVIYSNNKRASTVIGGVEYTTGLNLVGVDLTGKTYISTGRVAHSEVTPVDKLQYDLTTEERGEGTDAVRQYSAQFINNKASRRGGAINLVGKGNVEGVSFIDNYTGYGNSPLGGGAIYVEGNGNMALKNADFIENSSKVDGGAMVVRGKLTSDGNLVFAGNSAPYIEHGTSGTRDGGAIYCYGGNMNLKADVVTETRALFKDQKLTTVGGYGSEFLNNEANFGGAVEIQSGTLNFTKALFQRNKASVGGALYNETPFANVTVDAGTRFLQNYASRFAGAVYNNAGSFTSAAEYKNNWAANEGALYSVYEEGIDLGKLSNNYAIGDNTQYLYYNYWMDSYDGQEARQKVGKKMPVEVKYFGVAGLNTATESSLEPASAGFAGITSSPNSTQALGSVSEWNNIYAVVTLKESTVAGETMVQELDIDTNVFQVGALSVAEGWEGEVSVTDDAKVILTLTATSDCENVGENIASLKVLAPEEGLAQDTSVMGVEVTKMSCYDIVKDNRIDIQDLVAFARNFGSDNSIADFNDDARVDIQDLVAFARNFGKVNEVSDAEPLALAAKPEDIPQTIASQPVIPAQGALLETVEEKEESNAAALAAALPPVESQTQACDFIFANDDDEDDDWLDDICEKKDQEVQNLLIDDLFGKN